MLFPVQGRQGTRRWVRSFAAGRLLLIRLPKCCERAAEAPGGGVAPGATAILTRLATGTTTCRRGGEPFAFPPRTPSLPAERPATPARNTPPLPGGSHPSSPGLGCGSSTTLPSECVHLDGAVSATPILLLSATSTPCGLCRTCTFRCPQASVCPTTRRPSIAWTEILLLLVSYVDYGRTCPGAFFLGAAGGSRAIPASPATHTAMA